LNHWCLANNRYKPNKQILSACNTRSFLRRHRLSIFGQNFLLAKKFVTRAWHHGSGSARPQRKLLLFLFAFHFQYNFSFRLKLYLGWTSILNCFSFRISNEKKLTLFEFVSGIYMWKFLSGNARPPYTS
jgi:hypothetical protein